MCMIWDLASALPFLYRRGCRAVVPDIGTMVFRYSLPMAAASHCVAPSYDLPYRPTFPLLQFCVPSHSTAACMPRPSPAPL